jgi:peptide/nickel transport system permease protein
MTTTSYLLRRLVAAALVLLAIAALTFLVFHLLPHDVSQASCGKPCTAERREAVRHFLGYDQPVLVQLGEFLRGIVVGRSYGSGAATVQCSAPCFGYSFRLNEPVTSLIGERFGITASIALGAAVIWTVVGVTTGVVAALRRGSWIDRTAMASTVVGVSTPTYLVGLVGIYVLGFKLNVLPVGTFVPLSQDPVAWAWHLVLPWVVLAVASSAVYTRMTRSQMLDVLDENYVRTARAKGLSERDVVLRHALRNALLPVVTLFGLDLGGLLGGAVITEKIFSMQGIGALLVDSVGNLDLPVVLGVTLFSAFLIVLANLTVDLAYSRLDPRVVRSD